MVGAPELELSKSEAAELSEAWAAFKSEWFPDATDFIPPKAMVAIALAMTADSIARPRIMVLRQKSKAIAEKKKAQAEANGAGPADAAPEHEPIPGLGPAQMVPGIGDPANAFSLN